MGSIVRQVYEPVALIEGDRRTREAKQWSGWMRELQKVRDRLYSSYYEIDPILWNETASVATLTNAASMAGFFTLTEYIISKRANTRGRPFRSGRCDAWIADIDQNRSWAFEFKQRPFRPGTHQSTFDKHLQDAYDNARSIDPNEGGRRVGGLIMVPDHPELRCEKTVRNCDRLCASADLAYRVDGGEGPIWLAFKFVP